jgi:hypothetical protein
LAILFFAAILPTLGTWQTMLLPARGSVVLASIISHSKYEYVSSFHVLILSTPITFSPEDQASYEQKSEGGRNAEIMSVQGCHFATRALTNISSGQEILVSYGYGYWITRSSPQSWQQESMSMLNHGSASVTESKTLDDLRRDWSKVS